MNWEEILAQIVGHSTWILVKNLMKAKGFFVESFSSPQGADFKLETPVATLILHAKPPKGSTIEFEGKLIRKGGR